MAFLKRWGMWVAVLCLLGAGALVLFASWMTRLQWALVIAAAVLFVASAALNWREGASLLGRLADIPTPSGATPREIGASLAPTLLPIIEVRQGQPG